MVPSFRIGVSIFKLTLVTLLLLDGINGVTEDKRYWHDVARSEVEAALKYKWNTNTAKNVIIFLGDGMSPDTITASRIYNAGEQSYLAWEKFPHVGLLKTYATDKQVPDSAEGATALFCGVKTNNELVGVDANVQVNDCPASLVKENRLESILDWAQAAGKDTGFVTTTMVTHATPAGLFARSANRNWECESSLPGNARQCKDIARQLIQDKPGVDIKVIMGGGRQMLQSNSPATEGDPIDKASCYSRDGRHLMEDWAADKTARKFSHVTVQNNEELFRVNPDKTDFLLGIFANGLISLDWKRDRGPRGQPSLENMTTTAIKVLQKAKKGYFLMVEGGLIDKAHHKGHAAAALLETVRFSEAIDAALKLVDTRETLVIVTSDHGHGMTFQGISKRGADILGISGKSPFDGTPYTILGYSTAGPANMGYVVNGTKAVRKDPSLEDTRSFTYSQQAAVIHKEVQHSGVDVAVYAIGPHAHLFHSTHEQNFVAYAAAYAAKIGYYYTSYGTSLKACSLIVFLAVGLRYL